MKRDLLAMAKLHEAAAAFTMALLNPFMSPTIRQRTAEDLDRAAIHFAEENARKTRR